LPPSLEQEISAALDNATVTAAALAAPIDRATTGFVLAQDQAVLAREQALDPQMSSLDEARAKIEATALCAGRLQTLLVRLQRRHTEVAQAEREAEWRRQAAQLKERRDDLALAIDDDFDFYVDKLAELLARIATNDAELSRLHQSRPSGVSLHLDSAELLARELREFSVHTPSLLKLVKLYDRHGHQKFPPVVARDFSSGMFDPSQYSSPRYSAE
jgi:hypothetical protein